MISMRSLALFLFSACGTQQAQATETATEAVNTEENTEVTAETEAPVTEAADVEFETVGIDELEAALSDDNAVVVDTRVSDAYMGWAVDGAERGGHIPGATDFSYRWLDSPYSDTENLEGEAREQVLEQAIDAKGLSEKNCFCTM